MAELIPAPFRDLVTRLHREPATQDALFELPRRKWFLPDADTPDLSVDFHGQRAGAPLGPAAGPHTQMAQNILLNYVAGGRILELKTVQAIDQLTIPRPCIDMTNIGYNVEWSQELRVEQSLRQYVAGAMLIEIFRRNTDLSGGRLDGLAGAVIHDISVGYDLTGVRSEKVGRFLAGMRNAHETIEQLRGEIPREFAYARDLRYPAQVSRSVTLSTFHGCPADEIEKICEYLIAEHDLDVIVKMNPPMLGREKLEHLLHEVMGYGDLRVSPSTYDSALTLDDGVEMCERLTTFAAQRGRNVGFKFCNTLEIVNHRDFFGDENKMMYLSGQPLHVLTITLVDEFQKRVGSGVPISFSAGIDRSNFASAVACGFVPVTISTDLLRPGGYGRMSGYLQSLVREMQARDTTNIDEFIQRWANEESAARNTSIVAEAARDDPRYRAFKNRKVPQRIDSHLTTFDCLTCEKCMPVCPNAANFMYPTPKLAFDYHDIVVSPDGTWRDGPRRRFEITRELQIACFADFCNECGNCDTFCPEYGGPYIAKPSFFRTVESWESAANGEPATGNRSASDGFVLKEMPEGGWIKGRITGFECQLTHVRQTDQNHFDDGVVDAILTGWGHNIVSLRLQKPLAGEHLVDMGAYHTLRTLREGVLDQRRVNQVNVQWMSREQSASGAPR